MTEPVFKPNHEEHVFLNHVNAVISEITIKPSRKKVFGMSLMFEKIN